MDYPVPLRRAMSPDGARVAGQRVCREVSEMLGRVAHVLLLWGGAHAKDEKTVGLGVIIRIGAELADATLTLLDDERSYPAAALIRQLVEVEYLSWALAENLDEVSRWIHADYRERQKFFAPQRLRERSDGQFRDREYWTHCARGGHPHPDGTAFLPDPASEGGRGVDVLWDDLVFHLAGIWEYLLEALDGHPIGDLLTDERRKSVSEALQKWHADADEARREMSREFEDLSAEE